jgi:hypothetical protein
MHGQLDDRVGRDVSELARVWTQATEETRYALLRSAIYEDTPPLETLRYAIIVAEIEAGTVSEG